MYKYFSYIVIISLIVWISGCSVPGETETKVNSSPSASISSPSSPGESSNGQSTIATPIPTPYSTPDPEEVAEINWKEYFPVKIGNRWIYIQGLTKNIVEITGVEGDLFTEKITTIIGSDSQIPIELKLKLNEKSPPYYPDKSPEDFEVISLEETIENLAGTFENCIKIKLKNRFYWYAKNVGLLRIQA